MVTVLGLHHHLSIIYEYHLFSFDLCLYLSPVLYLAFEVGIPLVCSTPASVSILQTTMPSHRAGTIFKTLTVQSTRHTNEADKLEHTCHSVLL